MRRAACLPHCWVATCGVVCGEFLDRQKRVSVAAETKTNGVAKRGERDSVRDPDWRSGKQGPQGPRSEGSCSDLSGDILLLDARAALLSSSQARKIQQ